MLISVNLIVCEISSTDVSNEAQPAALMDNNSLNVYVYLLPVHQLSHYSFLISNILWFQSCFQVPGRLYPIQLEYVSTKKGVGLLVLYYV